MPEVRSALPEAGLRLHESMSRKITSTRCRSLAPRSVKRRSTFTNIWHLRSSAEFNNESSMSTARKSYGSALELETRSTAAGATSASAARASWITSNSTEVGPDTPAEIWARISHDSICPAAVAPGRPSTKSPTSSAAPFRITWFGRKFASRIHRIPSASAGETALCIRSTNSRVVGRVMAGLIGTASADPGNPHARTPAHRMTSKPALLGTAARSHRGAWLG